MKIVVTPADLRAARKKNCRQSPIELAGLRAFRARRPDFYWCATMCLEPSGRWILLVWSPPPEGADAKGIACPVRLGADVGRAHAYWLIHGEMPTGSLDCDISLNDIDDALGTRVMGKDA